MSRAVLPFGSSARVESFSALLPSLEESAQSTSRGGRLGRTAGQLEAAKNVAKAEGYALGLEEGRQAGFEQGRAEGYEEAVRREMELRAPIVERFAEDLDRVSQSVVDAVYQWFGQSEETLASLAVLIATRIVARELTTTEDVSLSIAREAMAEVTHPESARVRVNPFSVASLAEQKEVLVGLSPSLKNVQIVDDPTIAGGCVVESAGGLIDATVESRIASILAAVHEHYAAAQEPKPRRAKSKAVKPEADREAA